MYIPQSLLENLGALGYTGPAGDRVRSYTKDILGSASPSVDDCFRTLANNAGFPNDVLGYFNNLAGQTFQNINDAMRAVGNAAALPAAV